MKFVTKNWEEIVRSDEHLVKLVEHSLQKEERFSVGDSNKNCLVLGIYMDEGAVLELHRGKKWESWISPPIERDWVVQTFVDYYGHGDIADERLNAAPEWLEAAMFTRWFMRSLPWS